MLENPDIFQNCLLAQSNTNNVELLDFYVLMAETCIYEDKNGLFNSFFIRFQQYITEKMRTVLDNTVGIDIIGHLAAQIAEHFERF